MGGRFGLAVATAATISFLASGGHAEPANSSADRQDPGSSTTAAAGDPSASTTELDLFKLEAALNETVVTASGGRSEEKSLAAAEVVTVTQEEIRIHGWRSLAEVLANVPGLYVIDDLVLPSVSVRGVSGGLNAGTRIVKVMIDGTVVDFRPDLTAFLGSEFIPIEVVERVEIAKGPLSALYGANAFLATVNIITRRGPEGVSGGFGQRVSLLRSRGSLGASAIISYRSEHFYAMAAVSGDRNDRSGLSLQATHPTADPQSSLFTRESANDIASPISAYLQLGGESERLGRISFQAGLQRLNSAGEFRINSLLGQGSNIAYLNLWNALRYDKQWSKFDLSASAGYAYGTADGEHRLGLTGNPRYSFHPNVDYHAVNGSVAGSYSPFGELLSIRLGVDVEYVRAQSLYYTQTFLVAENRRLPGDQVDLIDNPEEAQQSSYDVGAFLHLNSAPIRRLPGLRLTADGRIDKIAIGAAEYDPQFSFRAAVAYRFTPRFTAKIFTGRAFQTPSLNLLHGRPGFGSRYNIVGNLVASGVSRLQPQTVDTVETAFSAGLFGHLLLDGGVYLQSLDKKIEFQQTGADFVATNQGRSISLGFELSTKFTYGRYAVGGWGTYVHTLSGGTTGSGSTTVQNPPPLFPSGMGVFSFDLDVPEIYLHFNVQGRVVGPRGSSQSNTALNNNVPYTLPTYGTADITISTTKLQPTGSNSDLLFLISLRNLADQRFSDPGFGGYDMPTLGRTLYFEARQIF
jgi:iron complex outermembrane receptor protein